MNPVLDTQRLLARWPEARAAFEELVEQPAGRQQELLGALAARDTELAGLVRRLLAEDRGPAPLRAERPEAALSGACIAGFRLLRLIGAGGMGSVYEAEQIDPPRRVALKLLHPGLSSGPARRRFEAEIEILAQLRHAHIATIFASGVEVIGSGALRVELPWYALEHLEGSVDLLRHAAERGADLEARVGMFLQLCAAVEHAHQAGVIHRDLKASNVLVDRQGHVKVIDFGIARRLGSDGSTPGATTLAGEIYGSLGCMAPEQFGSGPVGVRADVYALGALLFELLAGVPPLTLDGLTLEAAAQRVRLVAPRSLRQAAPGLPRELEWIVRQALAKEPSERYASAGELAADLRRCLAGQAVLAGQPGAWYRVAKWARRRRRPLLLACGLVALLAFGALRIRAAQQQQRAAQAREQLQREAAEHEAAGRRRLATLIGFAIQRARSGSPGQSAELAAVLVELERAIASGHGLSDGETIGLRSALASFWLADGETQRAGPLVDENLALLTRLDQRTSPAAAECLRQAAVLAGLRGDLSGAEALIAELRRCPTHDSRGEAALLDEVNTLQAAGLAASNALAPGRALACFRAAWTMAQQVHGLPIPALLALRFNLHLSEAQCGLRAEARAGLQRLLTDQLSVYGAGHARCLDARLVLARVELESGALEAAAELLAGAPSDPRLGNESERVRACAFEGLRCLLDYRRDPGPTSLAALELDALRRAELLGPTHASSLTAWVQLAEVCLEAREAPRVLPRLEAAAGSARAALGAGHLRSLELEGWELACRAALQPLEQAAQLHARELLGDLEARMGTESLRWQRLRAALLPAAAAAPVR